MGEKNSFKKFYDSRVYNTCARTLTTAGTSFAPLTFSIAGEKNYMVEVASQSFQYDEHKTLTTTQPSFENNFNLQFKLPQKQNWRERLLYNVTNIAVISELPGWLIIPLWIPPLTGFQSLVRYDSYCSHKPYGTSETPFSSTKGYLPSITSISKLQYIQQINNSLLIILLTTILPMETH